MIINMPDKQLGLMLRTDEILKPEPEPVQPTTLTILTKKLCKNYLCMVHRKTILILFFYVTTSNIWSIGWAYRAETDISNIQK
jgi:hypothetical protein